MVQRVADALLAAQAEILAENAADVEQAQGNIRSDWLHASVYI